MSQKDIRRALESRLQTLPDAPAIAWENHNFVPATGVPFLSTFILFTEPDDRGHADNAPIQRGYMQIGLHFPTNTGPGAADTMAEVVRRHFNRGLSISRAGITTIIDRTPEITGGSVEDNRYVKRVRIRFYAEIPVDNDNSLPDIIGGEWVEEVW